MRTNQFLKEYPPTSRSWSGKVTFAFGYPKNGWIQFVVLSDVFLQGVIIDFSYAFDPFPELGRWLNSIADGNLPAEFEIDEEGEGKTLCATPVDQDEFVFEILEGLWFEDESVERPIHLYTQVNKRQFLVESIKGWEDFLENKYDPDEWEQHGSDLRTMDLSRVRAYLAGN